MRFLRDRRTSSHAGRGARPGSPSRPLHLEALESRRLLSTLEIQSANLLYIESYGGVTNQLSISSTGPNGTYTIVDQFQTIQLGSNASVLGWTGSGTNTVTGPATSVTNLSINATNQDSNVVVDSIDAPANVTDFQSVVAGGATGLQGIRRPLTVVNNGGLTQLTVNDTATTTAQAFTIDTDAVIRTATSPVLFSATEVSTLIVSGGSGGNTFLVGDTGPATRLNTGTGVDTVDLTNVTASLSIDGQGVSGAQAFDTVNVPVGPTIAGQVNILGTTGTTALVIDDTASAVNRTATIDVGSITGYTIVPVTFNAPALGSLSILGGSGTDALTLDFAQGNFLPAAGGLTYDAGIGDNSLTLRGGSFINETINGVGPGAGSIDLDGRRIDFSGLAPIIDLSPAANFQINATRGSNTIEVVNGPNIGGTVTTEVRSADTPPRFELVDFANKTNVVITALSDSPIGSEFILLNNPIGAVGMVSLTILTGITGDTINAQATPAGVSTLIDTGDGDDVVSFLASGLGAGGADAAIGGSGNNTLNVDAATGQTTFSQNSVNVAGRPSIGLASFATVNITNAGDPPLNPVPVTLQGLIDEPLTNVVAGSFDDTDPRGQISNFTATIDWGDGTAPTAGTITQPGGVGTRFNVVGTHTYTSAGNFPVVVRVVGTANSSSTTLSGVTFNVSDVGGSQTAINSTAVVPSPVVAYTPIPVNAVEDVAFTSPVVSISAANFRVATFTATIDWGDGTAPSAGTVVAQGDGTFLVNGSHTYLRESAPGAPYPVTVHITDPRGVTTVVNTTATVLANDVVTTVADSGPGSLRAVIQDINADQIASAIRFNIPGPGPHRIAPLSPLPTIEFRVVIDGRSEPDFRGVPVVELNGSRAGATADGLTLAGGASTVQGLVINGFGGSGLILEGHGNRVVGNRIGTDVTGTRAVPNGDGIDIVDVGGGTVGGTASASGNIIGGTTASDRNIISGNRIVGVRLTGNGATGNRIQGNYIGTDVTGTAAVPNFQGIFLFGSPRNLIGGTAPGAGNVISGNVSAGVQIFNDATVFNGRPVSSPPGVATGNVIQGNRIGTNAAGTGRLGNAQGVFVNDASSTLIGGSTPAAANIIAGNRSIGVQILGDHATRNAVLGNFIGTNRGQARGLGNSVGVYVYATAGNVVGLGSGPGSNTIAFNREAGVRVRPLSQGPSVERVDVAPIAGGPITKIVITFTTYMNRARVLNANNYVITPIGTNSQPGARVPVVGLVYDEIYRTVTLALARPLARNSTFRLRVVGTSPTGLTDRAGNFLNGTPALPRRSTGTNFDATIRRGVVV